MLLPLIDPTFSKHSHESRPGRRAHDAVKAARKDVQSGKRVVVDVDLAKFFDRVNHDILIERLRKRIDDAGAIRMIRAYLNVGIMEGGMMSERHMGTPQGGPLSPLLANVLLDEVDNSSIGVDFRADFEHSKRGAFFSHKVKRHHGGAAASISDS